MVVQIVSVVAAILDHRWAWWDLHKLYLPIGLPVHFIAQLSIWFMLTVSLFSAGDYFVGFWNKIDRRVERRRRRPFILRRRKGTPVVTAPQPADSSPQS